MENAELASPTTFDAAKSRRAILKQIAKRAAVLILQGVAFQRQFGEFLEGKGREYLLTLRIRLGAFSVQGVKIKLAYKIEEGLGGHNGAVLPGELKADNFFPLWARILV